MTSRAKRRTGQGPQKKRGGTDLLYTCAWCKRRTREDEPCYGLGAKVRKGMTPQGQDGPFIHLALSAQPGRTVHCAITGEDSPARQAGWDIVFMACSEACAESLKQALQKEAYIGEVLGLPGPA